MVFSCKSVSHLALSFLAFSSMLFGLPAYSNQQNPEMQLKTASLAATCASCHGTNGQSVTNSAIPNLAKLSAQYIKNNMRWFKTDQRPATVMHQLAKGYTDEQIDAIANYLGKKD